MFKLVYIQLITLIGLVLASTEALSADTIVYWADIGFVHQIRIIAGLILMVAVAIFASIIFRSVWVKNGYSGLDGILVDKEVGLFMSHVLAFILIEVFIFMILFYDFVKPPSYAFWICGAGFLSPEAVQVLHFIMERFKSIKKEN